MHPAILSTLVTMIVYKPPIPKPRRAELTELLDHAVYFRTDNPNGDHGWQKPRRMDNARDPIQIVGRVRWIGSREE